ncbi:tripartite tricarboxylate transporter substrate binding protein [Nitrincola alkalilacustris]|uniref:tripartite tricarboxylate transporter substrate binding protein n=1 Tax=Nitrincola alkalilacustris TaxID=1571224 RepID=UPI00197E3C5E|nr:tripartite tricarboxylate transporter substrate binding protein [Nitrincola alkalilacustris]
MKLKNAYLLGGLISLFLMGSFVFAEDDFPSQPLTMLIGFNPGGSTDVQGQVLAEVLSEQLGQPVNIIYHPGAGGGAAAAMLASNTEQGYVFQYGLSLPFVFAPLVSPASYELNSFRYVAGISLDQSAIVTGPDKPFNTWQELIDYARENPGLTYATQVILDHFVINHISEIEELSLRIAPTTGGADMASLIISGNADFAISGGTHASYTDSGQMVVLASLSDERLVYYPEVPTLRELGYDISMHAIRVIAVPANTPDEHVRVLSEALEAVTHDPRFIHVTEERIKQPVIFMNSEELHTLFARQVEEYKQLIADSVK